MERSEQAKNARMAAYQLEAIGQLDLAATVFERAAQLFDMADQQSAANDCEDRARNVTKRAWGREFPEEDERC